MTLTDRQINNRLAKLEALEAEKKELEALMEALKDELKAELGDLEHYETASYKLNYTNVTTERLDSKALKKALPDVYGTYAKTTESRRFSYYAK